MAGAEGEKDAQLIAAHRALRADGDIQFQLPSDPGPPPTPAWIRALGRWLGAGWDWLVDALGPVFAPIGRLIAWLSSKMPDAPYARILLWTMIVALVLLIARIAYTGLRHGRWALPHFPRQSAAVPGEAIAEDMWRPEAAPAREWLAEADRLATLGRFGEAVHHLLLRSVEDIARRRPQLVRPALTSRDIARAQGIPVAPRKLFGDLAAVVERSLFGGAGISADEWGSCRAAYADFALPQSWQAEPAQRQQIAGNSH